MITGMPRIAIAMHDFEKCVATFRDALGMPVIDLSSNSEEALGAKVARRSFMGAVLAIR